ncbi:hypothetical protein CK203_006160 [Vitis vinifera]|uniref:Uncharacterized protein n=1 Tax=Vitis vinifera TaxID=29760 RepID=A0A438K605_VITVI|nr:hypothetical protein CK203_006160 [Vitis vinifera]
MQTEVSYGGIAFMNLQVYNGMTQLGFDKSHHAFSFGTEQTYVALYMTAIASLSTLVQKPTVKFDQVSSGIKISSSPQIFPEHGLKVGLSGSGATGRPPTTLSPTMLVVDWSCEKARDTPYEVDITIPVEGYEPIQFTLTKMCDWTRLAGWTVTSPFPVQIKNILKEKEEELQGMGYIWGGILHRGLDALPGMTILSACLEAVSGGSHYSRAEDTNSAFINQASWERQPDAAQGNMENK